jgi:hypothetical protein
MSTEAFHQQMDFIKSMGATDMVVAEFGQAVNPLPAVALFANRPIFNDRHWDYLCQSFYDAIETGEFTMSGDGAIDFVPMFAALA